MSASHTYPPHLPQYKILYESSSIALAQLKFVSSELYNLLHLYGTRPQSPRHDVFSPPPNKKFCMKPCLWKGVGLI